MPTDSKTRKELCSRRRKWNAIRCWPLGAAPDRLPEGNRYRMMVAKRALMSAYEEADVEPDTCVADLLADLRHLCDRLGLDYAKLDRRAYHNYAEEHIWPKEKNRTEDSHAKTKQA
jgi:hypothetical protein